MKYFFRKVLRRIAPFGVTKILMDYFWTHNDLVRKYPNSMIGNPLFLNPDYIELEPYTKLHDNVRIISSGGKVIIKKYSAIANGTYFIPGSHVPTVGLPQCLSGIHINDTVTTIIVGEDCWIGAECIFLQRARVGRGVVVGARSLISKEIPPYAVVAGSPAKIIAARFTIEQILKHEKILYAENERFTKEQLEKIFSEHYVGLRTIGSSDISQEDIIKLSTARKKINLDE